MLRHRSFPARTMKAVAGAMLIGTFTPLPALADDPLQPIIQTVERDRQKACPNSGILSYDKKLEALAQNYVRHEDQVPNMLPPGYKKIISYKGAGDPEAQAINRTYLSGLVGSCTHP